MNNDYLSGASDTLNEVEARLNSSIKRNNGARTTHDVVNVFNDVVTGIHIMKQEVKEAEVLLNEGDDEMCLLIHVMEDLIKEVKK